MKIRSRSVKLQYKIIRRSIIFKYLSILFISFLFSQDISGSYQFYGLYVIHQSAARYDTPINVSDTHGLGLTIPIDQIGAGEVYRTTYQGPYGHLYAQALNVILNVDLNEDGTGQISEGSYYPTEEVNDCIASINILPITDELVYTSSLDAGVTIPSGSILGFAPDSEHDPLPYAGQIAGSMSLSQSEVFDFFPSDPVQPTLCDDSGNCFDIAVASGETVFGGDPLPGFAGGYIKKGDLESIAPLENDCSDLYLEWHAIDGPISGSGLGDIIGEDEDGDGTDFDRIWAKETVTATYLNPSCGFNYPVFGDVSDLLESIGLGDCFDRVDIATEGYVLDSSLSNWSNFLTYNAVNGIDENDSGYDYNGSNGRLIMQFSPICIQDINVRHIMLEFVEVGSDDSCLGTACGSGDLNCDAVYNVLDIVTLANCVLTQSCSDLEFGYTGDVNNDGLWNVLDIVTLANCVLSQNCG